jgi:hypothetical protein
LLKLEKRRLRMKLDRFFYVAAGAIFLVLIVLGFQQYIFHGKHFDGSPIAPVMLAIVVAHSSAIFLWFVGFFVQALLISTHNRRVHMTLGWGVVGIAALIAATGPLVATRSLQVDPSQVIFDWPSRQFLLVMYTEIALFAAFVAHSQTDDADGLARDRERSDSADRAGEFDVRPAPLDGAVRASCGAGIAAAGGARGHDAELRSTVCHGPRRAGGGDFDRGKAGDDERLGRLGGDDPEAMTGCFGTSDCFRA